MSHKPSLLEFPYMNKIPCTIEILTLNSASTLRQCLESVKDFDDIVVLDGNSTDNTVSIAKEFGARVFSQTDSNESNVRIEDFSAVRNKGISLAKYKWFTFIDSDEYLSKEAVDEIREIVKDEHPPKQVFRRPRIFVLNGEKIERSIVYPNYQNRLFYLPVVTGFVKKVHENIKRKEGVGLYDLKEPEYVPLPRVNEMKRKLQKYLDIQAASLQDLSFGRLRKGLRSNLSKFFKYVFKYILLFFKKGRRMPFVYEYHTAVYHLRLCFRLIGNYYRR